MSRRLRYFSTFTGIGGLDWGLEKLGAQCVGFSEIKDSSIRIYGRHYPKHRNYGDITKIAPEELPDFDVFTGGFPCQSFSLAGMRKGFKDRRGQMIFYIYDILVAKQPEFVVLENVKGISMHDKGRTYRSVFALLQSAGYNVRVVLLNAMHYGSAQSRERVIFLCRRGSDFPAKQPEIRDDTKRFRDFRDRDESHFQYIRDTERNAQKIEQRDLYPFALVGGWDRMGTLTTGVSGGGGRNQSSQQKIVQEADGRYRLLTAVEGERLQGFPDGWTEGEATGNRWYAIGNAVNCRMSEYLFTDYLKGLWW